MKTQNNKDGSSPWGKDYESQESEITDCRKMFLLENYWKNIPHVPDIEY